MALVDFTSYDDIRAALGVSSDELEDATLSLPLYEFNLTAAFEDVSLTLADSFAALPVDPGTWAAEQKRFNQAVRMFATYAVAKHLTISLPLFSPKEISDGKAHTTRYAVDPYKATILGVLEQFETTKTRLIAALAALSATTATTAATRTWSLAVAPGRDPVTGA